VGFGDQASKEGAVVNNGSNILGLGETNASGMEAEDDVNLNGCTWHGRVARRLMVGVVVESVSIFQNRDRYLAGRQ
jgi:hypothetical protein